MVDEQKTLSNDPVKAVQEWSIKAAKYDELLQKHTRCVEDIKLVNTKIKELTNMVEMILRDVEPAKAKPKKVVKKVSTGPKIDVGARVDIQIQKLKDGQSLTLEDVKKDNTDLDTQRTTYIFYQRLSYLPNIQKAKTIVNGKSVLTLSLPKVGTVPTTATTL